MEVERSGGVRVASVVAIAAALAGLLGSLLFDTLIGNGDPWVPLADAAPSGATTAQPDAVGSIPSPPPPPAPSTTVTTSATSTSATSTSTTSISTTSISRTSISTTTVLGDSTATADDGTPDRLSDLLGPVDRRAAIPEDLPPRPTPKGMQISSIDVSSYPVREIGLEDDGQLEIPDETEIGWYRYGATVGDRGATVLAAHVSWNGSIGPFFELDTIDPGAQIEMTLDDGTTRNYEVTERTLYEKQNLPRQRIWRNTGPEELVLITCGGDFNPEVRRYRHNVVVYARPLD